MRVVSTHLLDPREEMGRDQVYRLSKAIGACGEDQRRFDPGEDLLRLQISLIRDVQVQRCFAVLTVQTVNVVSSSPHPRLTNRRSNTLVSKPRPVTAIPIAAAIKM